MPEITVDQATYDAVRLAANAAGVTLSEIVRRALAALAAAEPPAERDPWAEVPVHGEYRGRRVEGLFLPATSRLVVTTGALAGREFASPTAAATAVVALSNPERTSSTNGWRFWHVASGDFLDAVRSGAHPPTLGGRMPKSQNPD